MVLWDWSDGGLKMPRKEGERYFTPSPNGFFCEMRLLILFCFWEKVGLYGSKCMSAKMIFYALI